MQPETAEQRDHNVAERSRGHDEGQIRPRERGHVAGEENNQQNDADVYVQVEERVEEQREVMEIDSTDLFHAAGEERVSERGGDHDGEQDAVLLRAEVVLHPGVSLAAELGAGREFDQSVNEVLSVRNDYNHLLSRERVGGSGKILNFDRTRHVRKLLDGGDVSVWN